MEAGKSDSINRKKKREIIEKLTHDERDNGLLDGRRAFGQKKHSILTKIDVFRFRVRLCTNAF